MSYILLFLLFASIAGISAETSSSEIDRVKEHFQNSGEELPITEFSKPPKAAFYLNSEFIKNAPHQINLAKELNKLVPEWTPRLLALDPTCPYYFSKYNNISSPDDDLNLLSYLQAIESDETLAYPFINVLPYSYRSALPLLSIFHCQEFVSSISNPFFHNVELIVGPGKTELPLKRQSNQYSQLYCSLYGWPHFLLINQTKQPTIAYNAQTLLSQDDLTDIDFFLTNLAPGTCLFIPSDWVIGVQFNNSISLVFTLNKISTDNEPFLCTKTPESTLETIQFGIEDTFNMKYTNKFFFDYFQRDKNISQLILKWTPEIIDLIQIKLFQELDINHDEIFNIADYFDIKQSIVDHLQISIFDILEEIRRTVLAQYNQLNDIMKKIVHKTDMDENDEETLEIMMEKLPEAVKEKFRQNNIDPKDVLNKIKSKKSKQSSTKKSNVNQDL